jgi:hypothetical protein
MSFLFIVGFGLTIMALDALSEWRFRRSSHRGDKHL